MAYSNGATWTNSSTHNPCPIGHIYLTFKDLYCTEVDLFKNVGLLVQYI